MPKPGDESTWMEPCEGRDLHRGRDGVPKTTGMIPRPTVIRVVAASAVALAATPPARKQSSQSHNSSMPEDSAATANAASASGGRSAVKMTPSFVTGSRVP